MNAQSSSPVASNKTRKVVLQLLLGMVTGGGAMAATLFFLDRQDALLEEPGRILALGVAVVFGLVALLIGLGIAAPRFGEQALNVEDAGEIAEQKDDLLVGVAGFLLIALLVTCLALVPGERASGLISIRTGTILASLALAALIILSIRFRKMGDEMNREVSKEANGWALIFIALVFGIWGGAAQLGYLPMFAPLTFVAGMFALYLLAVFVAAGLRGMLRPR